MSNTAGCGVEFEAHEYGDGNNPTIASLVVGFAGVRTEFEPAIQSLLDNDHDVVLYEYPPDVFTTGDGHILPALARAIDDNFQTRVSNYSAERHTGVSMGGGIAWRMQRLNENALPGVYAACGTDAARLVMHGLRFRALVKYFQHIDIKKEFLAHGWDEESLRETWADIQRPPDTGFSLVVGGPRDYAVPHHEIVRKVAAWQRRGYPIAFIEKIWRGHTDVKRWFINNMPELMAKADALDSNTPE